MIHTVLCVSYVFTTHKHSESHGTVCVEDVYYVFEFRHQCLCLIASKSTRGVLSPPDSGDGYRPQQEGRKIRLKCRPTIDREDTTWRRPSRESEAFERTRRTPMTKVLPVGSQIAPYGTIFIPTDKLGAPLR